MTQITEFATMLTPTIAETNWSGVHLAAVCAPTANRTERIRAAVGPVVGGLPSVDEKTLARYAAYLSANLSLPFSAYYPQPNGAREEIEFRCEVVEVLDPARHVGDEFDGLFCKIRKGTFEVNLPLRELYMPEENANRQLIEDYAFWFANWR
jgi:hypothetical protein